MLWHVPTAEFLLRMSHSDMTICHKMMIINTQYIENKYYCEFSYRKSSLSAFSGSKLLRFSLMMFQQS